MGAAVAWAPEPADPFAACHARFEQVLQVAGSQETLRSTTRWWTRRASSAPASE